MCPFNGLTQGYFMPCFLEVPIVIICTTYCSQYKTAVNEWFAGG